MRINTRKLKKYVRNGLISEKKHPEYDIWIYNYTPECQYSQAWDRYTMLARWLILDFLGNVVALPFSKFFNRWEMSGKPKLPYTLYEKFDGSLWIMYWYGWKRNMATRGSFVSEQAMRGMEILQKQESKLFSEWFYTNTTYLREIIYPENRIVVSYGDEEKCVFLWARCIQTWLPVEPSHDFKYSAKVISIAHTHDDIVQIQQQNEQNKEWFVGIAADGTMFKIKYEEYVRLHRLLFWTTSHTIRQILKDWQPISDILHMLPDELHERVKNNATYFVNKYREISEYCVYAYSCVEKMETRKEQALRLNGNCKYPWLVFAMLDRKDYHNMIRDQLTPPKQVIFYDDIPSHDTHNNNAKGATGILKKHMGERNY